MNARKCCQAAKIIGAIVVITAASTRLNADTGTCGGVTTTLPFTDVMGSIFFCQIAEAYFSGLTNGTTPTTYSPSANVTREQMAAFITRTLDQSLRRGSERAELNRFWTNQGNASLALTTVGDHPLSVESDGADLWVANSNSGTVSRVRASDGSLIGTWTGADTPFGVLCAMGKIFVTGGANNLYRIDPTLPASPVSIVALNLGSGPQGIAFDGQRIWTANNGGSVSIVTLPSFTVNTVTTGFQHPKGMVFDGANIWVTDNDNMLKKLDSSGNILISVPVGQGPMLPSFDGTNIWVPNFDSNSVSVVRATGGLAGTVLATLTGNGLFGPVGTAFDGQRILVTNARGQQLSLWNASDLASIGHFSPAGTPSPQGACSDGLDFWIAFQGTGQLARF